MEFHQWLKSGNFEQINSIYKPDLHWQLAKPYQSQLQSPIFLCDTGIDSLVDMLNFNFRVLPLLYIIMRSSPKWTVIRQNIRSWIKPEGLWRLNWFSSTKLLKRLKWTIRTETTFEKKTCSAAADRPGIQMTVYFDSSLDCLQESGSLVQRPWILDHLLGGSFFFFSFFSFFIDFIHLNLSRFFEMSNIL